jgi:hypothetical protein
MIIISLFKHYSDGKIKLYLQRIVLNYQSEKEVLC